MRLPISALKYDVAHAIKRRIEAISTATTTRAVSTGILRHAWAMVETQNSRRILVTLAESAGRIGLIAEWLATHDALTACAQSLVQQHWSFPENTPILGSARELQNVAPKIRALCGDISSQLIVGALLPAVETNAWTHCIRQVSQNPNMVIASPKPVVAQAERLAGIVTFDSLIPALIDSQLKIIEAVQSAECVTRFNTRLIDKIRQQAGQYSSYVTALYCAHNIYHGKIDSRLLNNQALLEMFRELKSSWLDGKISWEQFRHECAPHRTLRKQLNIFHKKLKAHYGEHQFNASLGNNEHDNSIIEEGFHAEQADKSKPGL